MKIKNEIIDQIGMADVLPVSVFTSKSVNKVYITVSDNSNGIP